MSQMKEARYYEKLDGGKVHCSLCPNNCVIADGKRGACRVRKNEGGTLYSLIYGNVTSVAMDPVEKKPLYHFHPGREILSVGTLGCNLGCLFCQNYAISQGEAPTQGLRPGQAVAAALQHNSIGIAYTYNEPFIWLEYVLETAALARERGLKNVLITNGYVQQEPLREALPLIDALNIDIKSIRPEFYREICRGKLEPVLDACVTASKQAHVEVTNLVIPGHNDTDEDFEKLSSWIAANLGRRTPTHFSAYYPCYKMTAPPTPLPTLERAWGIASQHLDHVYLGNVHSRKGSATACASCKATLIERAGYRVKIVNLAGDGRCRACGADNNIVV